MSTDLHQFNGRGGASPPNVGTWHPAPPDVVLSSETVHLWRAMLDVSDSSFNRCFETLSDDERARALAISFQPTRTRFVASRATLRAILSRYLGRLPSELRFTYGAFGKPTISASQHQNSEQFHFNVSHVERLTLIAVANREVGVDVEAVENRRVGNPMRIAEEYFSGRDCAFLSQVPIHVQYRTFLSLWTRKEAVAKAIGMGLSIPLDRIAVLPSPSVDFTAMAERVLLQHGARDWTVMSLDPGPGYVGSLAMEGSEMNVEQWQLTATHTR